MKKFFALAASATMIFGAQAAVATTYSPTGTHVFSGPVKVQKDGSEYTCTMTVTVNAAATSATATAALSGGFPCSLISIAGTGTVTYNAANSQITITGFTIDPPLSPGLCNGSITVVWGGNSVSPRKITLSKPLSNSAQTAGLPCTMAGDITSTGGLTIN